MILAAHQPNFMPWLGFFAKMNAVDAFILLDDVSYPKNAWVNRVRIGGGEPVWLTVPVKKAENGTLIRDILISYDRDWARKFSETLIQRYGKQPFFNAFFPGLERNWIARPEKLIDLTVPIIRYISESLEIEVRVRLSSEFRIAQSSSSRLVKLCELMGATRYLAGRDSINYDDEALYRAARIDYARMIYPAPPYKQSRQSVSGFTQGLSVVDALFHIGPEGTRKLLALQ